MKRHAVGCLLLAGDKLLVLQRARNKHSGGTWALPAGKVDEGETSLEALVREVFEETGHTIEQGRAELVDEEHYDFPDHSVFFQAYIVRVPNEFEAVMSEEEHEDFSWRTPQEVHDDDMTIVALPPLLRRVGLAEGKRS